MIKSSQKIKFFCRSNTFFKTDRAFARTATGSSCTRASGVDTAWGRTSPRSSCSAGSAAPSTGSRSVTPASFRWISWRTGTSFPAKIGSEILKRTRTRVNPDRTSGASLSPPSPSCLFSPSDHRRQRQVDESLLSLT